MAKRKKTDPIEEAYYRHCAGTSISVMDISALYKEVGEAVQRGENIDDATKAAIAKYNQGAQ